MLFRSAVRRPAPPALHPATHPDALAESNRRAVNSAIPVSNWPKCGANELADVPLANTEFQPEDPICTVFATGRNEAEVQESLAKATARIYEELDADEKRPNAWQ